MIFGIPTLRFAIAILLGAIGLALIGCGVEVCWTRFGGRKRGRRNFPGHGPTHF